MNVTKFMFFALNVQVFFFRFINRKKKTESNEKSQKTKQKLSFKLILKFFKQC